MILIHFCKQITNQNVLSSKIFNEKYRHLNIKLDSIVLVFTTLRRKLREIK